MSLTYFFPFCVRQITAGRGLPGSRVFSGALADHSRARSPAQTPYPVTGRGQTRLGDRSPSVRGRGSTSLAFTCIRRILQCGYERDRYLLRISVSVSRSGSCPARRPSLTTAAQTLTQPLVGASRPGEESAAGDVSPKRRDGATTSLADRLGRCLEQREPSDVSDAERRPQGSEHARPLGTTCGGSGDTADHGNCDA